MVLHCYYYKYALADGSHVATFVRNIIFFVCSVREWHVSIAIGIGLWVEREHFAIIPIPLNG